MKRFLYTIGIACSIFNSQLSIAQSTYTLEQILDSARHNNITLRNAQRSVDAAEQQRSHKSCRTPGILNTQYFNIWQVSFAAVRAT